jgi:hypothetical protein
MVGISHTPCSSCGLEDVTDGIKFFMKKCHYAAVGLFILKGNQEQLDVLERKIPQNRMFWKFV